MRVVLITQGASPVVAPLLAQRTAEVVGVVESAPRDYKPGGSEKADLLIRFRRRLRGIKTLSELARHAGVEYHLLHKRNTSSFADWLEQRSVDVVVVYCMSQLLPKEVIEVPRQGILNLHPSLLPSFRGPNPWFWVYRDNLLESGVTLHFIDEGEDTGDIVAQRTFQIERGARLPHLIDYAIGKLGSELMVDALRTLSRGGRLSRTIQPQKFPTYRARNVTPIEYREMIIWQEWDVERVWHFLRGTESMLPCLVPTEMDLHKCVLRVGRYERQTVSSGKVGTAVSDSSGAVVFCRNGHVRVEKEFYRSGRVKRLLASAMRVLKEGD